MFLHLAMIGGMTAVSVPIIIHLLNKRKFERVVWAAMRFLRVSVEQNQRRIQMEDIILLLLRCLLIALVVFALMRPTVRSSAAGLIGGTQSVTAIIVLDNSASMSATDGVKSRFDRAKEACVGDAADPNKKGIIDMLPAGSSVAVLLGSDVAVPLIEEPTFGIKVAKDAIMHAQLSGRGTNLYPSIRKAMETLRGRQSSVKEIYVLTDGEANAFTQMSEIRRLLEEQNDDKKDVRTHLLFIGEPEEKNVGISTLRLAGDLSTINESLRFETEVTNYSKKDEVRDIKVTISVDKDEPSEETTIDVIPANQSKSVSMFTKIRTDGYHTVTAKINSDHVPADDSRSVALRGVTEVRCLLVDGKQGGEPRDSSTFFLRHALQPISTAERDQYFIKVTTVSASQVDVTKLDDYQVIALADVPEFNKNTLENLDQFVTKGGGLVVFPGAQINKTFYNEQMVKAKHLLPASFGEVYGDEKNQDKFFTLQGKGLEHSIMSLWNDPRSGRLTTAHFYRAYELIPDEIKNSARDKDKDKEQTKAKEQEKKDDAAWDKEYADARKAGGKEWDRAQEKQKDREKKKEEEKKKERDALNAEPRVIVKYDPQRNENLQLTNKPAIMERGVGSGRVVQFSSTANLEWNDLFIQRHIIIPLVRRVLAAAVQRQDEHLTIRVGEKFTHVTPMDLLGRDAIITRPVAEAPKGDAAKSEAAKAKELTDKPEEMRKTKKIEMVNGEPTLEYDHTDLAGIYEATISGDDKPIRFAAQSDPDESRLEAMTKEQLDSLGKVAQVVEYKPGMAVEDKLQKDRVGTEMWLPLAVLAIILATLETLLAHWFSQSK